MVFSGFPKVLNCVVVIKWFRTACSSYCNARAMLSRRRSVAGIEDASESIIYSLLINWLRAMFGSAAMNISAPVLFFGEY
jgi:hypothetical protein